MKKVIKAENSTALAFITKAGAKQEEQGKQSKDITFKVERKETKSRLLHIALKPSYYNKLEEVAKKSNLSVNETLNQVIKQFFKIKD